MNGTVNGELTVSPAVATVDENDPRVLQMFEIAVRDSNGIRISADVVLSMNKIFQKCFVLSYVLTGEIVPWLVEGDIIVTDSLKTNRRGVLMLNIGAGSVVSPANPPRPIITIKATINDTKPESFLPINVLRK